MLGSEGRNRLDCVGVLPSHLDAPVERGQVYEPTRVLDNPFGVDQLLDVETSPCGVDSANYERMIVL